MLSPSTPPPRRTKIFLKIGTEVPHDLHARAAVSKHDGVHPNATFDRIDAVALVVVATPEWNTGLVNMASHVGYGM